MPKYGFVCEPCVNAMFAEFKASGDGKFDLTNTKDHRFLTQTCCENHEFTVQHDCHMLEEGSVLMDCHCGCHSKEKARIRRGDPVINVSTENPAFPPEIAAAIARGIEMGKATQPRASVPTRIEKLVVPKAPKEARVRTKDVTLTEWGF